MKTEAWSHVITTDADCLRSSVSLTPLLFACMPLTGMAAACSLKACKDCALSHALSHARHAADGATARRAWYGGRGGHMTQGEGTKSRVHCGNAAATGNQSVAAV
jgi:hypothetical protein